MNSDTMTATYQGVTDAKKKDDREYRDPTGDGLSVSRGGAMRVAGTDVEYDRFPYVSFSAAAGPVRAHGPAAVALAWIGQEDRDRIRSAFPDGARHGSDGIMDLVRELNVSKHAVAHVANTPEEVLRAIEVQPTSKPSRKGRKVHRMQNVRITDYTTFLVEKSRPPSKGGNTKARHSHRFFVEGQAFSFLAQGAKKWIFASDTASFDYEVTEDGYRNVIPDSIVTTDKTGAVVKRGLRGTKKMRTADTRLPVSRREARD